MFQQTTDHLRERLPAPQSEPSPHQTPLYVFLTPEKDSGNIFTLPGGRIPKGLRNSTLSVTDNASRIIDAHGIDFKYDEDPQSGDWVHDSDSRLFGQARLIVADNDHSLPLSIDTTGSHQANLIPARPQPERDGTLELHSYRSLLARVQSLNYRREQLNERPSGDEYPLRYAEEAFLRSFGRDLLRRSQST
jgi:hypothetical protein